MACFVDENFVRQEYLHLFWNATLAYEIIDGCKLASRYVTCQIKPLKVNMNKFISKFQHYVQCHELALESTNLGTFVIQDP
jgi:hypothetical protein